MAVAVINIEIPQLLGSMVDIVTRKLMSARSPASISLDGREDFESLIRGPALKLIGLYLLQV